MQKIMKLIMLCALSLASTAFGVRQKAEQKQKASFAQTLVKPEHASKLFWGSATLELATVGALCLLVAKNRTNQALKFYILKWISIGAPMLFVLDLKKFQQAYARYKKALRDFRPAYSNNYSTDGVQVGPPILAGLPEALKDFTSWLRIEKKELYPTVRRFLAHSTLNAVALGVWCWFLAEKFPQYRTLLKSATVFSELLAVASLMGQHFVYRGMKAQEKYEKI